jgi:dienelactone hydrolase
VTYHWVDADREEILSANRGDRRELMVQIWYPARDVPHAPRAAYVPQADAVGPALADFLGVAETAFDPLEETRSNAVESAPVADDEPAYPVLIMLVGIKGSYRQIQTFQVEELVSHGYLVVALDQPHVEAVVVFPDGRTATYDDRWDPQHLPRTFMDAHIPYVAEDVVFVLDQLEALAGCDGFLSGRLDLDRLGLIGHSFGAVMGSEACRVDRRLRAALLEDAFMPADVVRAGLSQTVMFITRDADSMRLERRTAGGWPETDIYETLTTMRAVYDRLPGDGFWLQVPGMFHLDMTDAPFLSALVPWPGFSGPIGGERAHEILNAYSVAFFDYTLRGRPTPLLEGPSPRFPEVQFESRRV